MVTDQVGAGRGQDTAQVSGSVCWVDRVPSTEMASPGESMAGKIEARGGKRRERCPEGVSE